MLGMLVPVTSAIVLGCGIVYYLFPWIRYDVKELRYLYRCLKIFLTHKIKRRTMIDKFEQQAKEHPQKTFLIFQDNNYSYEFVNQQMNRVSHAGLKLGLKRHDVVALMMHSEPSFIWTAYGLSKIGVEPAYLNFNLRSKSLLHCFSVSQAKILIVGQADELVEAIQEILPDIQATGTKVYICGRRNDALPPGMHSLDDLVQDAPTDNIDRKMRAGITLRDTMCYIYTSGTTGLPKAAVVSHDKAIKATFLILGVGAGPDDIIYTPLPLYHSAAGLIALGITIRNGATMVLRSKFSATHFWEDCRKHNVTVIQYIGELCRYLCARPPEAEDGQNSIRIAIGNGLRRDIWKTFQKRFNIPTIIEFYAATEGNAGFVNHFNKFGAVGRSSPLLRALFPFRFLKYDYDTAEPVRDSRGLCIQVGINEPGLLVSAIKRNFDYDGYKGNRELSSKKVVCDVMRKGDKYFNTGDLLICDENYFSYFCDRLGDTFRWKGENVSTIEVSNVISDLPFVEDANVYGVEIQGQDGRAGMASITLAKGVELSADDLRKLYDHCADLLPGYAQPRFLRTQQEMQVTSTFKQQKMDLISDGFDPSRCPGNQLYYNDLRQKAYQLLDAARYQQIIDGTLRL